MPAHFPSDMACCLTPTCKRLYLFFECYVSVDYCTIFNHTMISCILLCPSGNRNHVKPQGRTGEVAPASVTPVPLESLTGLRSPQPLSCVSNNTTTNHGNNHAQTPTDLASAFPHLSAATSSLDLNDDGSMAGRGR